MNDQNGRRGPRPIPVTEAVRNLIRHTAAEPAAPPEPVAPLERRFSADDEDWIARIAGETSGGNGALATAPLVAVRFFTAADPDRPVREALLPRGRFESLYDKELGRLLRVARRLDADDGRDAGAERRSGDARGRNRRGPRDGKQGRLGRRDGLRDKKGDGRPDRR